MKTQQLPSRTGSRAASFAIGSVRLTRRLIVTPWGDWRSAEQSPPRGHRLGSAHGSDARRATGRAALHGAGNGNRGAYTRNQPCWNADARLGGLVGLGSRPGWASALPIVPGGRGSDRSNSARGRRPFPEGQCRHRTSPRPADRRGISALGLRTQQRPRRQRAEFTLMFQRCTPVGLATPSPTGHLHPQRHGERTRPVMVALVPTAKRTASVPLPRQGPVPTTSNRTADLPHARSPPPVLDPQRPSMARTLYSVSRGDGGTGAQSASTPSPQGSGRPATGPE